MVGIDLIIVSFFVGFTLTGGTSSLIFLALEEYKRAHYRSVMAKHDRALAKKRQEQEPKYPPEYFTNAQRRGYIRARRWTEPLTEQQTAQLAKALGDRQ